MGYFLFSSNVSVFCGPQYLPFFQKHTSFLLFEHRVLFFIDGSEIFAYAVIMLVTTAFDYASFNLLTFGYWNRVVLVYSLWE